MWLDGYIWLESGLSVMESIPNKWYCYQKGRPKSPQSIDICTGSLLGKTRYCGSENISCGYYKNGVNDNTQQLLLAHKLSYKPGNQSGKPFDVGELRELFKQRNRARKTWQFTRHTDDKNILNRLQIKIKRIANGYRQKSWEDTLLTLNTEYNS
ncbi:hypothetical protein TNCV_1401611 [Trichonephila clavipes]|nr:hypothetical protein TNCV_1401611 [Trichonephila clavipes]